MIQLKRFRRDIYGKGYVQTYKINNTIDFPLELDLSPYHVLNKHQGDNDKYELYGVINHYGNCGGGHYIAMAKNFVEKQWYIFDDCEVSKLKESEIITKAAYVLFYKKVKK